MKYYVVLKGHTTGIFTNRDDCKRQVDGFLGAQYKSFSTEQSAQFARKEQSFGHKGQSSLDYLRHIMGNDFDNAICTDAACPSNPGPIEWRGVIISTGEQIFHHGPYPGGSVNIAEFLAIVEGIRRMVCHPALMCEATECSEGTSQSKKQLSLNGPDASFHSAGQIKNILYSDSTIAISRVIKKTINTQIVRNSKNQQLFQLIDDAIQWLKDNKQRDKLITLKKRPTSQRGQIPADFGRK